jgi:hypothetical protein
MEGETEGAQTWTARLSNHLDEHPCEDERAMSSRSVAAALVLLLTACTRSSAVERDAGSSLPAPSADPSTELVAPSAVEPDPPAPVASAAPVFGLPPPAAEARRSSLRRLDEERALVPQEGILRAHFGGALPSPLELQTATLSGDRRAFLACDEPRRRNPLLLVTSASGDLFWTKERPLAGTRQVVTELAVAPGPHGEVALLWCDIPTQVVGLRRWAADGVVLADFAVLEVDLCEALAGLYWPGRGWVAVASQHGAARAQLLDEGGKRAWGPKGSELPWTARPSSPASIAVDSDVSVILLQVGDLRRGEGGAAPNRVLAMRYDTLGTALWEQPLDLGAAPAGAVAARIAAVSVAPGKVRVSLGAKMAATVTSAGGILGGR